jgi:hypothetical protein
MAEKYLAKYGQVLNKVKQINYAIIAIQDEEFLPFIKSSPQKKKRVFRKITD